MTSKILAGSIVGLFVAVGTARGFQQGPPIVLYSSQDSAGVVTEYRVTESKLAAVKPWFPERERPPLSIAAAVATAKKRLRPQQAAGLVVIGIKISSVSSGGALRWYYRVECYDSAQVYGDLPPETMEVLVLMDGSVVEPVRVGRG